MIRLLLPLFLIAAILTLCGKPARADKEATEHFDNVVAPVLAAKCLGCHNATERKGSLNLSSRQAALHGGESGVVLAAGKPSESMVWQRIDDGEMPPEEPLNENEKEILRRWIESGLAWGTDPIDAFRFSTKHRAGRDWWSFQPLVRPPLPEGLTANHPIDAFVQGRLRQAGLERSAEADPRALVRRLSFNLLGLPPDLNDIEFLSESPDPSAYGQLARRYLASKHYGEQWARHWLDVARYGESDGFEYDRMRPNAWPYRDWVIQALNNDMPFDQFARQQIAGDIIHPEDGQAITATGFLVCGAHDGLIPQGDVMRQIMRQDTLEDFVGTISQTFLGLTVNCARCHDHKFDPIYQQEYYRMTAAVAGVTHGERSFQPDRATLNRIEDELEQARNEIEAIDAPVRAEILSARDSDESRDDQRSDLDLPTPVAEWDFTSSLDDCIGTLHAELKGDARLGSEGAQLDGDKAYLATPPIQSDVREKTLEVWVRLSDLEQRGGAAISLQTSNGEQFDGIVFGEREPRRWMAGSDGFSRTSSFNGNEEDEAHERVVHLAITYADTGTISGYRNGQPYGTPYQSNGPFKFKSGDAHLIFGLRHGQPGSNRMLRGIVCRARLYDVALTADQVAVSANLDQGFVSAAQIVDSLNDQQRKKRHVLIQRRDDLQRRRAAHATAKVFAAVVKKPAPTHFLNRGNPLDKGKVVTPGGLGALQTTQADFQLSVDASDSERRLRLADWIASPNNSLFARVIVNRLWHYHFGNGLVITPNDFGFNGGHPSHPQLLDWLACELIENDWSLKEIHYLIVTSDTFRQSSLNRKQASEMDADNRLLWRFSPRRLSAEELRDAILSVAGQLNRQIGGPPFQDVRPYFHRGAQFYDPIDPTGDVFNRRSIYRMWARGGRNPLLDAFDCPDPSATAPKRAVTTTPIQALTMLNSSFVMRMSELFAKDLQAKNDTVAEQVHRAYERALARPPAPLELTMASRFVDQHNLAAFCRVLLNSNEFLYVE